MIHQPVPSSSREMAGRMEAQTREPNQVAKSAFSLMFACRGKTRQTKQNRICSTKATRK